MSKCWGTTSGAPCEKEGDLPDNEVPAQFVNPEDPDGPKVRPGHCREHHDRLMTMRDENEASWARMLKGG